MGVGIPDASALQVGKGEIGGSLVVAGVSALRFRGPIWDILPKRTDLKGFCRFELGIFGL